MNRPSTREIAAFAIGLVVAAPFLVGWWLLPVALAGGIGAWVCEQARVRRYQWLLRDSDRQLHECLRRQRGDHPRRRHDDEIAR